MKRSISFFLTAAAAASFFVMPATHVLADSDPPRVVKEAKKVEESKREAEFTAPEAGQVWLVDMTDGERVLHSITLNKGHRYGFNTSKDYVIVNGREGEHVNLDRDHTYAIFYVTDDARDAKHERRADKDRDDRRSDDRADRARVPDTAEVVDEGRNEELSYEAKSDGMAYLYNATDSKVIESWRLSRGDRITISPRSNAISINQKTTSRDLDLDKHKAYRLLFDRKSRD